ncbi:SUKH-3 domain-containing protein [Polyangium aurulentum]|uniref:SUKH-3 domain-containing protein n=1 Tax=Polyangium aurulentum TaxID=2567896 RepID=UPI0010AE2164|nr:SUKH-3 domain-containing protein [Polyangium aurulentum]UQA57125.1 SUKH-3 domain-containing protein [Polyangium aurulentum]
MTSLNIESAQQDHLRLFECLRAAGWSEGRNVPIPDDWLESMADIGFFPDDYQEKFLRSFGGLRVRVQDVNRRGKPTYAEVFVGIGDQLDLMDAQDHLGYIQRLAGTADLFPVIMSGGNAVFALKDARCLAIEVSFRGCAWASDPFEMMDWLLFKVRGPKFDLRVLTMEERPPIFRW